MPRKPDSDTRLHFRIFQDEDHTQKRAFCLHCQKDACADNIQRMKNHLLKCDIYLNAQGSRSNQPVFQPLVDASVVPDAPTIAIADTSVGPGPDTQTGPPPTPEANRVGTPTPAAKAKAMSASLNNVRLAMARSTSRLTDLENVLKTQLRDGMHNAATHVKAAIRDERDRLFKLAQTLVAQETKMRESQNALSGN